jgi:hypothetical protein
LSQEKRWAKDILTPMKENPSIELTDNPDEACLFVVRGLCALFGNRCDWSEIFATDRLRALPYWNGNGRNHVIFDSSDDATSKFVTDDAILVQTAFVEHTFRRGFDIQLLLFAFHDMHEQAKSHPILQRTILASFQGSETWPVRAAVYELNNGNDVIASQRKTGTEFEKIMLDTKFALMPRGLGSHMHRLMEALTAGCIPIVISDGYVWPMEDRVNWKSISFRFAESEVDKIMPFIRTIPDNAIQMMHDNIMRNYGLFVTITKKDTAITRIQDMIIQRREPHLSIHWEPDKIISFEG